MGVGPFMLVAGPAAKPCSMTHRQAGRTQEQQHEAPGPAHDGPKPGGVAAARTPAVGTVAVDEEEGAASILGTSGLAPGSGFCQAKAGGPIA